MKQLSSSTWGPEERQAVIEVLDSGMFTMGKRTAEFERAYAEYVGTEYCVACNSGSSANLLMVASYTLRRGGPGTVIVPALGWSTSYSPFQQYGWKLVFVDIDPDTLNYDLEQLRAAASLDADAILAINVLGNPNEFAEFPRGIDVLEDNCEAMGCEYQTRRGGAFGVMGTHSTFFSHHICTMEGGMVTTDSKWHYDTMLSLRSHGWTRHLPEDNVYGVKPGKFDFILPGYNLRPTEMQCAIGLEQLKKLPGFVEMRRENAERFPYRTQRETGKSSWFGMTVYGKDRARFDGFETRPVISGNFTRQAALKYYDYRIFGDLKGADYVHENAMMVGNNGTERIEWPE